MKKIYIKYLLLLLLLLFQGIMLVSSSSIEEDKYYDNAINVYNKNIKNIEEIFNELSAIKGVNINNIEKDNAIKVDITIEGSKEEIVETIKKFKGYSIINYQIDYKDENFCVNLFLEEYKFKRKM